MINLKLVKITVIVKWIFLIVFVPTHVYFPIQSTSSFPKNLHTVSMRCSWLTLYFDIFRNASKFLVIGDKQSSYFFNLSEEKNVNSLVDFYRHSAFYHPPYPTGQFKHDYFLQRNHGNPITKQSVFQQDRLW